LASWLGPASCKQTIDVTGGRFGAAAGWWTACAARTGREGSLLRSGVEGWAAGAWPGLGPADDRGSEATRTWKPRVSTCQHLATGCNCGGHLQRTDTAVAFANGQAWSNCPVVRAEVAQRGCWQPKRLKGRTRVFEGGSRPPWTAGSVQSGYLIYCERTDSSYSEFELLPAGKALSSKSMRYPGT